MFESIRQGSWKRTQKKEAVGPLESRKPGTGFGEPKNFQPMDCRLKGRRGLWAETLVYKQEVKQ